MHKKEWNVRMSIETKVESVAMYLAFPISVSIQDVGLESDNWGPSFMFNPQGGEG